VNSESASVPVALATLRWGRVEARPTALLLHGISSSAETWWRVADELAAHGWSVTAVDLRGHGVSPRTTRYRLADYAADVTEVTSPGAAWDVVIGHSLGGAVSVVAAAAHPEWARTLLLLDPVLALPGQTVDDVSAMLLAELDVADAGELLRSNPQWHPEDAALKARAARRVSRFAVERTARDNPDWHLEEVAGRLASPVRVLAADPALDSSFPVDLGDRLAARAARFSYAVVDGAGHSVHRDDPERVVAEALAMVHLPPT
jgi:pimeloyl-ACP methyl ester carboxylesterase